MKCLPRGTYEDYAKIVASTRWSHEPLAAVMTPLGRVVTTIPLPVTGRLFDGIRFGGALVC